jgi:hypothetical protein
MSPLSGGKWCTDTTQIGNGSVFGSRQTKRMLSSGQCRFFCVELCRQPRNILTDGIFMIHCPSSSAS